MVGIGFSRTTGWGGKRSANFTSHRRFPLSGVADVTKLSRNTAIRRKEGVASPSRCDGAASEPRRRFSILSHSCRIVVLPVRATALSYHKVGTSLK